MLKPVLRLTGAGAGAWAGAGGACVLGLLWQWVDAEDCWCGARCAVADDDADDDDVDDDDVEDEEEFAEAFEVFGGVEVPSNWLLRLGWCKYCSCKLGGPITLSAGPAFKW